jgi:hypothetical protein
MESFSAPTPAANNYLPHHFGDRFSKNALIPSWASAAAAFVDITSLV